MYLDCLSIAEAEAQLAKRSPTAYFADMAYKASTEWSQIAESLKPAKSVD